MLQVLCALVPAIIGHAWFFGPGILVQIVLACLFALVFEAAMLSLRSKPLRLYLDDYSAVVTAVLFALCVPPLAPWWIAAVGMFFAIVVAKHLYGGLGHNLFNPAMVGYVVVLISFPVALTSWLQPAAIAGYQPGLAEVLLSIATGHAPGGLAWDSVTGATDTPAPASPQEMISKRARAIFGDFGELGWSDRELVALGGYALAP
jgi:electron transport complex protein RnfD